VYDLLNISAALSRELSDLPETPVIMVIGEIDTGKSTLVALIAQWFRENGKKVAVVDSDIGQSDVGPPGFVSYGFAEDGLSSLKSVLRQGSYMVGKTSPYGRELPVLIGVQSCVRAAKSQGADVILVDTCGLVRPTAGVQLKCAKAQAIEADIVIALSTPDLTSVANSLESLGFRVKKFAPLPGAQKRSPEQRGENRVRCWNRYAGEKGRIVDVDPSRLKIVRWWGETRHVDVRNLDFGTVGAVPDPHSPGFQIPCIWMKSEEKNWILGQLPEDYEPDLMWVTSYRLGVEGDMVTSA